MAARVRLLLSIALVVALGSTPSEVHAQRSAKAAADIELPPITWACPMNGVVMPDGTIHRDIFEDGKGTCPVCQMALAAVRLDSIWTCPVHSVIAQKKAGTCPIDHRDLVQVTVAMTWTCAGHPEIDEITPKACPDGSAMTVKYTPRAHGNHNPQHGGQFFMAPDNWTHVEGTFPRAGQVRIYVYDDFTKPLPAEKIKPIRGRIITRPATATTKEVAFPLTLSRDGRYLEAKVDSRSVPAPMVAKLQVKPDGPEYHFDFTFTDFSKETAPVSAPAVVSTAPTPKTVAPAAPAAAAPSTPAVAPPSSAAALAPPPSGAPPSAPPPSAPPPTPQAPAPKLTDFATMINPTSYERTTPVPATIEGIMAELKMHDEEIRGLIGTGGFTNMWVPAFQAKDLALAMNDHVAELPTYKRTLLEPAIARLIRSAWLLDAFGDLGNRQQIDGAYARFSAAVTEVQSVFERGR